MVSRHLDDPLNRNAGQVHLDQRLFHRAAMRCSHQSDYADSIAAIAAARALSELMVGIIQRSA
jgi:hypothetical protein